MNSTQTASKSQKGRSATLPVEQITTLETQENERVEREILALQKEKEDQTQVNKKKEEQAQEKHKEEAKAELKTCSEKELSPILTASQKETQAELEIIETKYNATEVSVATDLTKKASDPDYLLAM